MKIIANCSDSLSLAYQVYVNVCNPIPLSRKVSDLTFSNNAV